MQFYVGFSKEKAWYEIGSELIQLGLNASYSHAYIKIFDEQTGLWMVYEASKGYVNSWWFTNFLEKNTVIKEYQLTVDQTGLNKVLTTCRKNLGLPYSDLEVILLAIKLLFHFQIKYNNNGSEFICSQFAATVCEVIGIQCDPDLSYETPTDLDKTLAKNNIPCSVGVWLGAA